MKDKLKLAMEQFYLGLHLDQPLMSDLEFDTLRQEDPELVSKILKEIIDDPMEVLQDGIQPLSKKQVIDNDLRSAVKEDYDGKEYYCNLKYDGSSIRAYYRNGVLLRILGSPDGESGIDRTKSLWNLFPTTIPDKRPISLIGEVLVDYAVYGELARNKANGLVNSKHQTEEVENECFIRVYRAEVEGEGFDYYTSDKILNSLQVLVKHRHRFGSTLGISRDIVFDRATQFYFTESRFPTTSHTTEIDGYDFQLDGVVVYSPEGIQGYKFYFTESAITTITDIDWKFQPNGSYAPTLLIDPIELNGKSIRRVSANGVPNMLDSELGVGASVKVILANSTIPKVTETLEGSTDFRFPKCTCGYQLSEKDIFGSTVKCQGDSCTAKIHNWIPQVLQWIKDETLFKEYKTMRECIVYVPAWFAYLLFIDRWDPFDKVKVEKVDSTELLTAAELGSAKTFRKWMVDNFYLTDLQIQNMDANIMTSIDILNGLVDRSYIDILEGKDDLSDLLY